MIEKENNEDYRYSHTQPGKGSFYDFKVYGQKSGHRSIWLMERQYLTDVISRLVVKKNKYLDFACGTGRIIEIFADGFNKAVGLDISEPMLSMAKKKNIKAELLLADITENPDIAGGEFDLITAFRFFLNAQQLLRYRVIDILAEKLTKDGILIFNIHNSKPSFLCLQNAFTNLFTQRKIPSLSRKQVTDLVKKADLEIVETRAFGIIPKAAHIISGARLWGRMDKTLQKVKLLQKIGSDVIYVCRKKR